MKKCIFLVASLILPFVFFAQLDKPLRIEVNVPADVYPFSLLMFDQQGVLLHTANGPDNKTSSSISQVYYYYDQFLVNKWQTKTYFPQEYAVVGQRLMNDTIFLILRNQSYYNTLTPTLIYKLSIRDASASIDTLTSPSTIPSLAAFIDENHVWTVQRDRSECSVVIAKRNDTTVFHHKISKFSNEEVIDVQLDTATRLLYLIYTDENRRDDYLNLLIFDTLAQLVSSSEIRLNESLRPISGRLLIRKDKEPLILGTFNLSSERQRFESYDRGTETAGYFSVRLQNHIPQFMGFLNFANFTAIESSLSPNELQRYKRRKDGRRQVFSMDNLMQFEVVPDKESLLIVGESYNREVRTQTETYYDYYGRVVPYTTTVFDGYSFNDVYMLSVDSLGRLEWSKVIDISTSLNTKELYMKTATFPDNKESVIAYLNATNVFYKSLQEPLFNNIKVDPMYRADRVTDSYFSRIVRWYGPHFLILGYQTIQNNNIKGPSKRYVFYMSKLTVE